jgi:hypothetical protein
VAPHNLARAQSGVAAWTALPDTKSISSSHLPHTSPQRLTHFTSPLHISPTTSLTVSPYCLLSLTTWASSSSPTCIKVGERYDIPPTVTLLPVVTAFYLLGLQGMIKRSGFSSRERSFALPHLPLAYLRPLVQTFYQVFRFAFPAWV